jgi:hypothetical protein
MSAPTVIKVGRTGSGYRVRVEGRGTLKESPAVQEFAGRVLGEGEADLVVDLLYCDYLDSTFLGCLLTLQKRHGAGPSPRVLIAATDQVARRLFAASHLGSLFRFVDAGPAVVGAEEPLPTAPLDARNLAWHVMECHRRLAEVDGPDREAFAQVADALASELVPRGGPVARRGPRGG